MLYLTFIGFFKKADFISMDHIAQCMEGIKFSASSGIALNIVFFLAVSYYESFFVFLLPFTTLEEWNHRNISF